MPLPTDHSLPACTQSAPWHFRLHTLRPAAGAAPALHAHASSNERWGRSHVPSSKWEHPHPTLWAAAHEPPERVHTSAERLAARPRAPPARVCSGGAVVCVEAAAQADGRLAVGEEGSRRMLAIRCLFQMQNRMYVCAEAAARRLTAGEEGREPN